MTQCSRRGFLKTGLAAGAWAGTGSLPLRAAGGTATDWVTHGKIRRESDAAGLLARERSAARCSAILARTGSPAWFVTLTTGAFASMRHLRRMPKCIRCWAWL